MPRRPRTRGQKVRRVIFLASVAAAAIRFAMARRPTKDLTAPRAPEWPPLEKAAKVAAPDTPAWVEPLSGACPLTHPVKGNAGSGIYHVPGGRFYDATLPERCYRDPAAAEADGMRASKR